MVFGIQLVVVFAGVGFVVVAGIRLVVAGVWLVVAAAVRLVAAAVRPVVVATRFVVAAFRLFVTPPPPPLALALAHHSVFSTQSREAKGSDGDGKEPLRIVVQRGSHMSPDSRLEKVTNAHVLEDNRHPLPKPGNVVVDAETP